MNTKAFHFLIVIEAAKDLPGVWSSISTVNGVVSQGNSPVEAYAMIKEALELVLEDDFQKGFGGGFENYDPAFRMEGKESMGPTSGGKDFFTTMPLSSLELVKEPGIVTLLTGVFARRIEGHRCPVYNFEWVEPTIFLLT